jgi:hypothetical protein
MCFRRAGLADVFAVEGLAPNDASDVPIAAPCEVGIALLGEPENFGFADRTEAQDTWLEDLLSSDSTVAVPELATALEESGLFAA